MIISLIPNTRVDTIHCSQGDTAREWEFRLISNDSLVAPTGTAALICDQTEIPLTIDGDKLLCDSTDISNVPGFHKCKIKLTEGDEVLYSSLFYLHVEERP